MEMEEMDLLELWRIVIKRKQMIFILFVIAVVASGLISMVTEPVYQASTTMMLKSGTSASLAALDPLGALTGGSNANVTLQNYIFILRSRTMLEDTLRELGLENDPEITLVGIRDSLSIQQIAGTEILQINFDSPDREFATDFVNTLSDVFINSTRDSNRSDLRTARQFLAQQIQVVGTELRDAEEKLREFRETERIIAPMEGSTVLMQQYNRWDQFLTETIIARIEAEQRINQIEQQLAGQDEMVISSTSIQNNPMVQMYQQRLAELEIALSGARERYTERHPEVLSLQAEIEEVRIKLTTEVERVVGTETQARNPIHNELYAQLINLQVELVALNAREDAVTVLRDNIDEQYSDIPAKELELVRLMRDAQLQEEIYIMLMTENEEIRINEEMHSGNLQLVDSARIPENPIKPRVKLNIAIGGVLGLFVGFGLAFLLEFMDNTVKTKEEVEALLELPVIGQIPEFEGKDQVKLKSRFDRKLRM